MELILQAVNLTKIYGTSVAVQAINFAVRRGEIFGFLGPNGAGKTSTINMLIGLARPTSGSVLYLGEDLTRHIKKAQKLLGIVADESNLYEEMSGFDNLCFCGALYGMSRKSRELRALRLLELFGLTPNRDKRFRAYSKGMKRKLTIAAAIMHEPEILFLDEPTTGIDVESARKIRSLLKELNAQGTTIFMTTHYIEEAERLCDKIVMINHGQIIRTDTVANLLQDAQSAECIEIMYEYMRLQAKGLAQMVQRSLPHLNVSQKDHQTIKIISQKKMDIAPVVQCLATAGVFIREARIIRPTLEDVFVRLTGIDVDQMNREKEKR